MSRCMLIVIGIAFLTTGCTPSNSLSTNTSLRVVATTSIVADMVREVGGDRVQVISLMPPGVDPHRYTPKPADATELARADLAFYSGLHLEGKMVDVLEQTVIRGRKPISVTGRLNPQKDLRKGEAGSDGPHDPHVWFDVVLWSKCIAPVCDGLCEADPSHADQYRQNAERYRQRLADLDRELKEIANRLPREKRILVTSHDAFHYFGAGYGFEVHGLQGISTASEVGVKDRQILVALLIQKKIKAVFGETSVPSKGLESVLDSVKAATGTTVMLIGGDDALYSDALGEPGSPGETYIGMCRHNMNVIVKALSP